MEQDTFADASELCYAAVVYLKSYDPQSLRFPFKSALNASQIDQKPHNPERRTHRDAVRGKVGIADKGFSQTRLGKSFFWTDSLNVYYWIKSETPLEYDVYVRNRLIEIARLTSGGLTWLECRTPLIFLPEVWQWKSCLPSQCG